MRDKRFHVIEFRYFSEAFGLVNDTSRHSGARSDETSKLSAAKKSDEIFRDAWRDSVIYFQTFALKEEKRRNKEEMPAKAGTSHFLNRRSAQSMEL